MSELNTYLEGTPFTGIIGRTTNESVPAWPVPADAPEGSPNILVIVLDDTGYAQLGCYGGLGGRIRTPNMDRLADEGIRYINFHTTALCSPTRAALLTGRNHHTVGVATIMEAATGYPGYNARIPRETAMLPAVLVERGFNTMALGKWHLTPDEHESASGPYDRWPLGQGFERFYGFLPGETSQWEPDLWEDNHKIDPPGRPEDGYHLNEDLVDHAIDWINAQKVSTPNKPFFMYFCTGAMHSPHHAPKEYIEEYKGAFDAGWDIVREETLARQKELGVVPENTELPAPNPGVKAWASLGDGDKRLFARQMEVFAAYLTHTDHHVGRLIDFLEEAGVLDDTLVILVSDNGASGEGGANGLSSEMSLFNLSPESIEDMLAKVDDWGSPSTHPHYATGWAMAGNTPNRWYKQTVHEGGTRDPFVIRWPARIKDAGSTRTQFHHVVDVTPTILEILGLNMPDSVRGYAQRPLEGESMAYSFADAEAPTPKKIQYFEMLSHRAIWAGGWKAVTTHWSTLFKAAFGITDHEVHDGDFDADVWELYNIDEDFSEVHDLASENPAKLTELRDLWWAEAGKHQVLPLDDNLLGKMAGDKPRVVEDRDTYTYFWPVKLVRSASPQVKNVSHVINADIKIPEGGAEGVIVSDGGLDGGYVLCIKDRLLCYVSNYLNREHYVATSDKPVPSGEVSVRMEFEKTVDFAGNVTLYINGDKVGGAEVKRTNPLAYAVAEGLEIGSDSTSPVWPEYTPPFNFTGTIKKVELRLKGGAAYDAEGFTRMAQFKQ